MLVIKKKADSSKGSVRSLDMKRSISFQQAIILMIFREVAFKPQFETLLFDTHGHSF